MKSEQDKEKIRKLLLKRFDEEPSKEPEKAAAPETERPPPAAEPKAVKEPPSPPPYTPPPQGPMDKTYKYAIGALALAIASFFWRVCPIRTSFTSSTMSK